MSEESHLHPADPGGLGRLAIDATLGVTDLVEALHQTIARAPELFGVPSNGLTQGIAGLVYESVRAVTRLVGGGLDQTFAQIEPLLRDQPLSPERDAVLAALNGVLGDHLAASANPLALPMWLYYDGQPLAPTGSAVVATIPRPGRKILLLAHGLCLNERHWSRNGHDHGAALAADLGYTPLYLRYNTGLHISTNGRTLADMLEALLQHWPTPVEELVIVAHSMGGLVSRSACHYGATAGQAWPRHLRKIVFLGTPHHGAPLERCGNWVNLTLGATPYSAPFAQLGQIRSAGITDLRYGSLLSEDWEDQDRFAHTGDRRSPVPLPRGVQCYAVAATIGKAAGDVQDRLLGDGLVPLASALGRHSDPGLDLAFPESHQWISYGTNHLDLLRRRDVYEQVRQWLARSPG